MKFAEVNMNGTTIGDVIGEIISDVLIGGMINDRLELNKEIAELAEKYDSTPTDMITNITGTIFANHCDNIKDTPGFDAKREVLLYQGAGKHLLEVMDRELKGQSFDDKLLTLLNAVCVLAVQEDSNKATKSTPTQATTPKRTCGCPNCVAKAKAEASQTSEKNKKEEITSILDRLYDLVK